ncbi:DUF2059 domain-containing protein [Yeosuana sp. AK3]|nr:DUF2059 domain-containing protein [Flavobacteriia bacterium]NCP04868.1 DUF2059 domain-containing protein [Flavobacteriales bacterium]PIV93979.1 MAG: hypothetical protein COW44_06610 [Flavobacteriaceae bacterium CG17_big_fil_post_rev_8_21_14_2_50_33_15]PIY11033.1 MAG: hypothetical protein COZ17_08055 [Flavobacteriaceae bacterium CG_4_10_14_3_um_filter_33_47]PJB19370.1 MAG: hypothetical protein CO117_04965 [Flavobacteriaceae bacterium CG_4_9_14_3_um_filter_33_16]
MKKIVLVCLFLVAVATQAQDNADFKNETVEFLKITGAATAFENAIAQIGAGVSEANKEAYTKEAMGTLDGLYDKMADLYMAEFTQDEIRELVVFYNTSLGKKLAEKQVGLSQKAMMFGQSWGMEVSGIAQKYN